MSDEPAADCAMALAILMIFPIVALVFFMIMGLIAEFGVDITWLYR